MKLRVSALRLRFCCGVRFGAAACACGQSAAARAKESLVQGGSMDQRGILAPRCIMYAETNQARNASGGPFGNSWALLATAWHAGRGLGPGSGKAGTLRNGCASG